jgi:hypothetical protein
MNPPQIPFRTTGLAQGLVNDEIAGFCPFQRPSDVPLVDFIFLTSLTLHPEFLRHP